jgi:hypothetical protein
LTGHLDLLSRLKPEEVKLLRSALNETFNVAFNSAVEEAARIVEQRGDLSLAVEIRQLRR